MVTLLMTVFQVQSKPLVVAHRGASKRAPENSYEAFKLAFRKHADAVEVDIRVTKDSVIVCHHDRNTKRMTGADHNIDEVNYNEIKDLILGKGFKRVFSNVKIPKLKKLLSKVSKRRKLYIEIKTGSEILPPLKKLLEESKAKHENLTVISFSKSVLKDFKSLFPEIKTLLLVNLKNSEYLDNNSIDINAIFADLKDIKANGISCKGNSLVTELLVNQIHENGYELHVWTVDAKDNAILFKKRGVNSITTNYPKRIKKVIR